MTILEQIEVDLNQAQKQKEELVVLTLRQIKAAATNAEIAKKREKLTQEEIIKVLKSEVKKRKEAIELYQKGGRNDLAKKEQKEIEIVNKYLPPELPEQDIRNKVREVIENIGALGPADLGKVMGPVMAALKGAADGKVVNQLVKEELEKIKPS